jgi:Neprosin
VKGQIPINNQIRKTIQSLTRTIVNLRKAIKNNASLKGDVIVLVCSVLLISGCSKSRVPPPPPTRPFQPFDAFVASVQHAQSTTFVGQPGFAVESAGAFEEMKRHLLELYEGVTARNSFVGPDRQIVDCIPIEQQPGLRPPSGPRAEVSRDVPRSATAAREAPGESRPSRRRSEDITLKRGQLDRFNHEVFCEAGTIPMRRITLEEMATFRNLASFLAKDDEEKDPNQPADDSSHYYARGVQFVDNLGGDSWLNVWNPTVSAGRMSLSQQWFVSGEDESKQTIEGGWQVMPSKYKIDQAALFIYYTTKGYAKGSGCYNLECSGFVQIANNVYLGRGFSNYSSIDGDQWGFNLQWKRHTDGNWWLFYRGPGDYIAVGYYPSKLYGEGGLAARAAKIAFGGEDTGKPSALEMGSGRKASENWRKAAYQNLIFYIDTNTTSQWANLDKYESNADCYTADVHNITGSWGTYIFFGGPKCN